MTAAGRAAAERTAPRGTRGGRRRGDGRTVQSGHTAARCDRRRTRQAAPCRTPPPKLQRTSYSGRGCGTALQQRTVSAWSRPTAACRGRGAAPLSTWTTTRLSLGTLRTLTRHQASPAASGRRLGLGHPIPKYPSERPAARACPAIRGCPPVPNVPLNVLPPVDVHRAWTAARRRSWPAATSREHRERWCVHTHMHTVAVA
mmetsp:Transcript_17255/g.51828  ORF Transcript_17255/g.51828 Transcript_17255/m.51828 type:complete len:201 (-) Transcript_17255:83-685(-)